MRGRANRGEGDTSTVDGGMMPCRFLESDLREANTCVLRMMVVMWLAFFCTPHPFYLLIKGTLIVTHRFLDIEERTCSRREARKDERRLRVAWERLKSNLSGRRSGCDDIQCSLSERST